MQPMTPVISTNPVAPEPTSSVQRLQGIKVGKKLGSGNFGEVYIGTWNGSEIALKKLSEGQAEEFEREASLLW